MGSLEKSSASSGFPSDKLLTGAELLRRLRQRGEAPPLSTRLPGFDALQDGGLRRGAMLELVGPVSSGRFAIASAALSAATSSGENAALVDLGDSLDPYSASAAGIALSRLLWVRPRDFKEAVLSTETVLSAGFPLVVLDCGARPQPWRRVPDAAWLRLSRLVELNRSILLVVTPKELTGSAASAVVVVDDARPQWLNGKSEPLLAGLKVHLKANLRKGLSGHREGTLALPVPEEKDK